MIPSLRLLQKSTALRAAVGFGLGGVGFALGNLLLARALPPAAFGVFTLFLALVQMGASLAPIGLQGQVNRHPTLAGLARSTAAHLGHRRRGHSPPSPRWCTGWRPRWWPRCS